jgi:hypothetical protein
MVDAEPSLSIVMTYIKSNISFSLYQGTSFPLYPKNLNLPALSFVRLRDQVWTLRSLLVRLGAPKERRRSATEEL